MASGAAEAQKFGRSERSATSTCASSIVATRSPDAGPRCLAKLGHHAFRLPPPSDGSRPATGKGKPEGPETGGSRE
jgi:hypothetical protein